MLKQFYFTTNILLKLTVLHCTNWVSCAFADLHYLLLYHLRLTVLGHTMLSNLRLVNTKPIRIFQQLIEFSTLTECYAIHLIHWLRFISRFYPLPTFLLPVSFSVPIAKFPFLSLSLSCRTDWRYTAMFQLNFQSSSATLCTSPNKFILKMVVQ